MPRSINTKRAALEALCWLCCILAVHSRRGPPLHVSKHVFKLLQPVQPSAFRPSAIGSHVSKHVFKLLHLILCPTLPLVTERRVLARFEYPHQQLQATERKEGVYISFMSSRERSEEHTSALQSRQYLVCRLMLENHITLYLEFCLRLELYQYK